MQLKRKQELLENLSLSLAALLHSWVLLCVVHLHDVVVIHLPTVVFVQLFKCLLHQSQSPWIQIASNYAQELFVLDSSVSISVKGCEKRSDIYVCHFYLRLNYALSELGQFKSSVSVFVHDLEDASDSDDCLGSTYEKICFERVYKLLSTKNKSLSKKLTSLARLVRFS